MNNIWYLEEYRHEALLMTQTMMKWRLYYWLQLPHALFHCIAAERRSTSRRRPLDSFRQSRFKYFLVMIIYSPGNTRLRYIAFSIRPILITMYDLLFRWWLDNTILLLHGDTYFIRTTMMHFLFITLSWASHADYFRRSMMGCDIIDMLPLIPLRLAKNFPALKRFLAPRAAADKATPSRAASQPPSRWRILGFRALFTQRFDAYRRFYSPLSIPAFYYRYAASFASLARTGQFSDAALLRLPFSLTRIPTSSSACISYQCSALTMLEHKIAYQKLHFLFAVSSYHASAVIFD